MSDRLSKKIFWVNFVLSCMIVSYHAYNIPIYDHILHSNMIGIIWIAIENYISGLQRIAVPLFFFMSGFLFFLNYSPEKALNKIKKRVYSLLIPYFLWNTIAWAYYAILKKIPYVSSKINLSVSYSLKSIIYDIIMGTFNALWFVRILFFLILLSPLVYIIIRKAKIAAAFFAFLIIMHLVFYTTEFSVLYASAFYFGGAIMALHNVKIIDYELPLGQCALVFLMIINAFFCNRFSYLYLPLKQIVLIIYIILFWYGCDFLINRLRSPAVCPWFFKHTFFIYCAHGIVLESVEKIFLLVLGNTIYGSVLDYILAPVITLTLIFLFAKFVKYKMPVMWRVLNGGRV